MIIITFLIILLILITVHELGHYVVAKIFNVYVTEFALGFGPKIFSHKGKETEFSIRALPLGGYAAMVGEDGEIDEDQIDVPFERTLKGVNRFKQFLIMFAGSFMNILLGFIIFCFISFSQSSANPNPIIGGVAENSPAYEAGLKVNDEVVSIIQDGKTTKISSYTDILLFSNYNSEGNSYTMTVIRDDKELSIDVFPKFDKEAQRYTVGISSAIFEPTSDISTVISNGYELSVDTIRTVFISLKMLVTGQASINDLSGPIGIVDITQQVADSRGLAGLISLTALLSINLAIFNLLPIPALDGGRIFIIAIESITRKKLNPSLESKIIGISFLLLIGLIIVVTFNDIMKIFIKLGI